MSQLLSLLNAAKVYDLGQPYFAGMPHHPMHPPFLFGLVKRHGDYVGPAGNSSASDAMALGSHVGTHIDALCHFSCGGKLHGGEDVAGLQSQTAGLERHSIDTVPPILRRGVLLDIAGLHGTAALDRGYEITPQDLETARCASGIELHPGDVVLLRTGWGAHFEDPARFISEVHGPGPAIAGARWLSERKVFAAGSDTVAFEKVPDASMPVHVHLLVDSGIHIIECLNLEELAAARVREFALIAVPMKLRGATGAPLRPLALVSEA